MRQSGIQGLVVMVCCAVACGGGGGGMQQPDAGGGGGGMPGAANSVNGIVTDIGTGARIAGAMVVAGGRSVATDAQGQFTLSGLASGTVNLAISKPGYAPSFARAQAGERADAVIAWLKQEGAPQAFDPRAPITLSQKTEAGPYAVIFQPGTLDTSATDLQISITPLDPTKERQALPGNLLTGGADPAPLIPVTFAEFTITDGRGARVNLKPAASAIVELPIPPALRASYPIGAKIHCYSYNGTAGTWEDFVEGTVQISSVDGTSPVLAAQVRHFSWYGGAPQGENCVDVPVRVVSVIDGRPLGNARVEATPGTVSYTDADGNATITTVAMGVTTYTAYQTGIDVDGSLTGLPGAKFIEFGEVAEQTAGSPSSCRGTGRVVAAAAAPAVTIKIGVIKNALYSAFAQLVAGGAGAGGATVVLQSGVPGPDGKLVNPLPASGAIIALVPAAGGAATALTEVVPQSGLYVATSGAAVTAGAAYTLQIDGDGNGSIDGQSTIFAVGELAWVSPRDGADVAAAGFTARWSDTAAAGNPGYAPIYEVVISSPTTQDVAVYVGTAPEVAVTSTITGGPLMPATYTANLTAFSGFTPVAGGGFQLSNNITGVGVTGTFVSVGTQPADVTFTVH